MVGPSASLYDFLKGEFKSWLGFLVPAAVGSLSCVLWSGLPNWARLVLNLVLIAGFGFVSFCALMGLGFSGAAVPGKSERSVFYRNVGLRLLASGALGGPIVAACGWLGVFGHAGPSILWPTLGAAIIALIAIPGASILDAVGTHRL